MRGLLYAGVMPDQTHLRATGPLPRTIAAHMLEHLNALDPSIDPEPIYRHDIGHFLHQLHWFRLPISLPPIAPQLLLQPPPYFLDIPPPLRYLPTYPKMTEPTPMKQSTQADLLLSVSLATASTSAPAQEPTPRARELAISMVRTHQFRHWLNSLAQQSGLSNWTSSNGRDDRTPINTPRTTTNPPPMSSTGSEAPLETKKGLWVH